MLTYNNQQEGTTVSKGESPDQYQHEDLIANHYLFGNCTRVHYQIIEFGALPVKISKVFE